MKQRGRHTHHFRLSARCEALKSFKTCSNPQQGLTQNNQSSLEISGARFGPMSELAAGGNSMPATCHLSLNTSKYHEIPSC